MIEGVFWQENRILHLLIDTGQCAFSYCRELACSNGDSRQLWWLLDWMVSKEPEIGQEDMYYGGE